MNFDIEFALKVFPIMLKYLKVTLALALGSIVIGLIIAFFIAIIVYLKVPVLDCFFKVYISFFRGTPLVAQLFCLYFGLLPIFPSLALKVSSFGAAMMVMSLNSSAYMAESLRGALNAVDKGQTEAALAVGMTYPQAMVRIVFPQAFRIALPTLASSFINVLKDTSLTFYIGVKEMMAAAQLEAASSYRYLEGFVVVLIIYWIMTSVLSFGQNKLEKKFSKMVGENQ